MTRGRSARTLKRKDPAMWGCRPGRVMKRVYGGDDARWDRDRQDEMSVETDAFEWVRERAYQRWGRTPKAERRVEEVAAWCADASRAWRAGGEGRHELSDAQIGSMSRSIARFVVDQLVEFRKRPPARTTAEGRATERLLMATAIPDWIEEDGERVTARKVAAIAQVSERKASRALAERRGAPKREAQAAALDGHERALFDVANALLPDDGFCVLRVSDLEARLWPEPAETDAARRKRRSRLLKSFEALRLLSFHVVAKGDLLALRRGRTWKPDDAAARLAAAASKPGLVASLPAPPSRATFWTSTEVRGLVATLRVALKKGYDPDVFRDFIAIQRVVLDGRATENLHRFAHRISGGYGYWSNDLPTFFSFAAAGHWGIRLEPGVRDAVAELGRRITLLEEDGKWGRSAESVMHSLECFQSRGSPLFECFEAEGRARITAFRAIIEVRDRAGDWIDIDQALALCDRLAREEEAGRWSAEPYLNPDCPF